MPYKKLFLITLLISLAGAAAIGIVGLMMPTWGERERLLETMMSVGLFSLTLLGTAVVLEKRTPWRIAMLVSVGLSVMGLALFLFAIWYGDSLDYEDRRIIGKWMVQAAFVAVALPLAGLLSLTRFDGAALRAVRLAGIGLVFVAVLPMSAVVWSDFNEELLRTMFAGLILAVLSVVALPILHKLAGMPPPSETVAPELEIEVVCPRCKLQQPLKTGPSRCARCRLKISIEVEEPRCPKCSYLLYHLTEPRCPECGEPLGGDEVLAPATQQAQAVPSDA